MLPVSNYSSLIESTKTFFAPKNSSIQSDTFSNYFNQHQSSQEEKRTANNEASQVNISKFSYPTLKSDKPSLPNIAPNSEKLPKIQSSSKQSSELNFFEDFHSDHDDCLSESLQTNHKFTFQFFSEKTRESIK